MEEIHFKLYKRYQKEMEILPFKNSRTALQKKIKDKRGACQNNNNNNNNNNNKWKSSPEGSRILICGHGRNSL